MEEFTTIKIYERQLKRLMADKIKYRQPYFTIIEGYQKLIKQHNLNNELDQVMKEFDVPRKKITIKEK